MLSVSETNIKNLDKIRSRYVLDPAYPTRINVYLYSTNIDEYTVHRAELEQNMLSEYVTNIKNLGEIRSRYLLDPSYPTRINVYLYSASYVFYDYQEQNINNLGEICQEIVKFNDPTFGINQVDQWDDSNYCRYVVDPADPTCINVYLYSAGSNIYHVYQAELEI